MAGEEDDNGVLGSVLDLPGDFLEGVSDTLGLDVGIAEHPPRTPVAFGVDSPVMKELAELFRVVAGKSEPTGLVTAHSQRQHVHPAAFHLGFALDLDHPGATIVVARPARHDVKSVFPAYEFDGYL